MNEARNGPRPAIDQDTIDTLLQTLDNEGGQALVHHLKQQLGTQSDEAAIRRRIQDTLQAMRIQQQPILATDTPNDDTGYHPFAPAAQMADAPLIEPPETIGALLLNFMDSFFAAPKEEPEETVSTTEPVIQPVTELVAEQATEQVIQAVTAPVAAKIDPAPIAQHTDLFVETVAVVTRPEPVTGPATTATIAVLTDSSDTPSMTPDIAVPVFADTKPSTPVIDAVVVQTPATTQAPVSINAQSTPDAAAAPIVPAVSDSEEKISVSKPRTIRMPQDIFPRRIVSTFQDEVTVIAQMPPEAVVEKELTANPVTAPIVHDPVTINIIPHPVPTIAESAEHEHAETEHVEHEHIESEQAQPDKKPAATTIIPLSPAPATHRYDEPFPWMLPQQETTIDAQDEQPADFDPAIPSDDVLDSFTRQAMEYQPEQPGTYKNVSLYADMLENGGSMMGEADIFQTPASPLSGDQDLFTPQSAFDSAPAQIDWWKTLTRYAA